MMSNWDMMSKSNCDQQFHSQKTVHEDNYCLHLLDMCFLWRLVWWGKMKWTTSNEAPTSNKAFAREGRLWWKEKTRKSLPSKEINATKAEEKLDAKGDKNLGIKLGCKKYFCSVTYWAPVGTLLRGYFCRSFLRRHYIGVPISLLIGMLLMARSKNTTQMHISC